MIPSLSRRCEHDSRCPDVMLTTCLGSHIWRMAFNCWHFGYALAKGLAVFSLLIESMYIPFEFFVFIFSPSQFNNVAKLSHVRLPGGIVPLEGGQSKYWVGRWATQTHTDFLIAWQVATFAQLQGNVCLFFFSGRWRRNLRYRSDLLLFVKSRVVVLSFTFVTFALLGEQKNSSDPVRSCCPKKTDKVNTSSRWVATACNSLRGKTKKTGFIRLSSLVEADWKWSA